MANRGSVLIIAVCLMLLLVLSIDMPALADTVIPASEFEDVNFYNFIIDNYDANGNGQLEQSEAEIVTYISLDDDMEVDSLKGIEYFKKLTRLQICDRYTITDCSVIGTLEYLETLHICDVRITDVNFLQNLKWLKELELSSIGNVVDFSVVSQLKYLEDLKISGTGITDASFVEGLTNLESLWLGANNLTQLPDLSSLTSLVSIDVSLNKITDFSELLNVKDTLVELNINSLCETDATIPSLEQVSFLSQMTNLSRLYLSNANLYDIPDLTALTNLIDVNLGQNYLTVDTIMSKLPTSLTSQANWVNDSGLNNQNIITPPAEEETSETVPEESEETPTPGGTEMPTPRDTETPTSGGAEIPTVGEEVTSVEGETDTSTETTENGLSEDVTVSDGNYVNFSIADIRGSTNLEMSGDFGEDVYVVVDEILDRDKYVNEIKALYQMYDEIYKIDLYDINVYSTKTHLKVQPKGDVEVAIPIDESIECKYYVLRLEENGSWTEIESFIKKGKLRFLSDHFSIYSVIMAELVGKDNNQAQGKIGNSGMNNTGNNDESREFDYMAEAIVIAVLVAAVFIYDKLRKCKDAVSDE